MILGTLVGSILETEYVAGVFEVSVVKQVDINEIVLVADFTMASGVENFGGAGEFDFKVADVGIIGWIGDASFVGIIGVGSFNGGLLVSASNKLARGRQARWERSSSSGGGGGALPRANTGLATTDTGAYGTKRQS